MANKLKELYFWPNGIGYRPKLPILKAIKDYPTDPRLIALVKELLREIVPIK